MSSSSVIPELSGGMPRITKSEEPEGAMEPSSESDMMEENAFAKRAKMKNHCLMKRLGEACFLSLARLLL